MKIMKLFLASAIISISLPLLAVAQAPVKTKANAKDKQFVEQAALNNFKVVGAANMAKRVAHDEKLKAFSEMELSEHNEVNIQLNNLAKSKNIDLPKTSDSKNGTTLNGKSTHRKGGTKTSSSTSAVLSDQNSQGKAIPKTGEGANNSANGNASGSMISGSTSNTNGGTSEDINTDTRKILNQQNISDALHELSNYDGLAFDGVYVQMMISDHENAVALFEAAEKSTDPQIKSFASKNLSILRRHLKTIKEIRIPSNVSN